MNWQLELNEDAIEMLESVRKDAADARMDALMLLEHLKVAIERLEYERGQYRLTPIYLEEAIRNLKQTARDYDFKLKGENDGRSAKL